MNDLLYIMLSIVEGLVIFYYSFSVFRINVFDYTKEIAITSIVISIGTYYYSQSSFSNLSALLNIVSMILALIFIFRISLLHSIFISTFGFVTCLVIQAVLILVASTITNLSLEEIRSTSILKYSLQIIIDIVIFSITWTIKRKHIGFTFVPYMPSLKFKLSYINIIILIGSVVGIAVVGTVLETSNLLIGTAVWIICFFNLIFIGLKKELKFKID